MKPRYRYRVLGAQMTRYKTVLGLLLVIQGLSVPSSMPIKNHETWLTRPYSLGLGSHCLYVVLGLTAMQVGRGIDCS